MSKYNYKGLVLVGGIVGKRFDVYKFCIGKLHRNDLISADAGGGGAALSPNYLQSVFDIIAREKVVTILKKVNNPEDSYVKKQVGRDDGIGGFGLAFEAIFNDGASRYFQMIEFWSAKIIYKAHIREKGIGNLSVFTFETEAAEVFPVSQTP
jgi:hypothetical protein